MPMTSTQAFRQLGTYEDFAYTEGAYEKALPFGNLQVYRTNRGFDYFWNLKLVDKHRAVQYVQTYGEAPAR